MPTARCHLRSQRNTRQNYVYLRSPSTSFDKSPFTTVFDLPAHLPCSLHTLQNLTGDLLLGRTNQNFDRSCHGTPQLIQYGSVQVNQFKSQLQSTIQKRRVSLPSLTSHPFPTLPPFPPLPPLSSSLFPQKETNELKYLTLRSMQGTATWT